MDPLWAELINSDCQGRRGSGQRGDQIASDAWLGAFLARAGWQEKRLPAKGERGRLRTLRATLQRTIHAIRSRRAVTRQDLAALNRALCRGAWVRQVERGKDAWKVSTRPSARGIGRVEAEVAWSFASMLATADPARIKVCANPDCGWVMVDESRNRTRRWCEASECGNLLKVRRFRQRQRARAGRA